MSGDVEVRGVRLSDVYRDTSGELWEVVGLCTDPTAIVRNVTSGEKEHHVIGCLNWHRKWKSGPLRAGVHHPENETVENRENQNVGGGCV